MMSAALADLSDYQCPDTGGALHEDRGRLITDRGKQVGVVRDGVVYFESTSCSEDQATAERLRRMNVAAGQDGWEAALHRFHDEAFVKYIFSPVRRRYLEYLPLDEDSHVLEIGPGLGQFTSALATRARLVDALEVVPEQSQFTALRMKQERVTNVRVAAGGRDCRLPYRSGTFDLVLLNLVFEWCAARSEEDHVVVQRRMLAEMHRVLRPGGRLYLATKNRFGISYLCGRPDEHFVGMRFGSALPRGLAKALYRRRQPGMLHSYSRLRGMLGEAGFTPEKSWWAAPDCRFPEVLVETDSHSVRAAREAPGFVSGHSRLERLVLGSLPASMVKHVMPGLNFLALKPPRPERSARDVPGRR